MGYFDNAFFPPVANDEVEVLPFLEASSFLSKFLDLLSSALKLVKSDIEGNIRKIRHSYDRNPEKFRTLRSLIVDEMQAKVHKKDASACVGLLWLKRGLDYVMMMLNLVVESYRKGVTIESCNAEFRGAYEYALKRHHNWISQQLFKTASVAFPKRRHLIRCLATGDDKASDAEIMQRTATYIQSLKPVIDYINRLYVDLNLEPNENQYPKDFMTAFSDEPVTGDAPADSSAQETQSAVAPNVDEKVGAETQ